MMRFRLRGDVDEEVFLEVDSRLQSEFAYMQPGLVRRTTARGDEGEWVVIDLWRTAADADACSEKWESDPTVGRFMAMIDTGSIKIDRYRELDA